MLEDGSEVCERCEIADTAFRRLRGLIGRSELRSGEGVLLRPCGSVHTFLMRFPIDVIFCDADLRVLSVAAHVPPRRLRAQRGSKVVIEIAAGDAGARGVTPGKRLRLEPVPAA